MVDLIIKPKLYIVLFVLTFWSLGNFSYADDMTHGTEGSRVHIHGTHKECSLPQSNKDIIDCALSFHPVIKRSLLKIDSTARLERQASQIPNPTFSSRYVRGESNEEEISELETNISFTLELGGKRDSRKEYAIAKNRGAIATSDAIKANVKIMTVLNMHRLRQLLEEKKLLSEATIAFSKVIRQLKKLPRLTAEQEVSLTLFEVALEETKIDESIVFEEERKLEHYFHVATGHSIDEIKSFLPKTPTRWPGITSSERKHASPRVKKLKTLANLAQKKLEIQKSDAWPDLKIGPSFSIEKDGELENKMVGFNIQIPIPLFQVNGGGKAYARSELLRAKKNVLLTAAEENHERFEQLRIYESSVSILNKTMKQNLIEKKHTRIERLYLRGVVSSSVFLDSLKQKLSYFKRRSGREMTALTALWNIYKYDGKVFEEKI